MAVEDESHQPHDPVHRACALLARRFHWTEQQAILQLQTFAFDAAVDKCTVASSLVDDATREHTLQAVEAWLKSQRDRHPHH